METTSNRMAYYLTVVRCLYRIIVLLVVVFLCTVPIEAHADDGVHLVKVMAGENLVGASPAPSEIGNVCLEFDKNVSYMTGDDAVIVAENLSRVYVLDGEGNHVESVVARTAGTHDERKLIYLRATEWLPPLTEFTVVAEEGIRAKSGEISIREYRAKFTTGPGCSNGFTVYENVSIVAFVVILLSGTAGAFVRRRRA